MRSPPPILSPAVTSTIAVVTGAEERTNREDLSQNPKNTKRRRETLTCPLSLCVCAALLLEVSEISSDCAFGGEPVIGDRWRLDSEQEAGENLTGETQRWRGRAKEDEKVTRRIVAFEWWQKNTERQHDYTSHHPTGWLTSHRLSLFLFFPSLFLTSVLVSDSFAVRVDDTVFSHLEVWRARTHTGKHSGYLEGHFFSWSGVHTDPADCCNLHCKVMGRGLDVYLCGDVCVCVCVCSLGV